MRSFGKINAYAMSKANRPQVFENGKNLHEETFGEKESEKTDT